MRPAIRQVPVAMYIVLLSRERWWVDFEGQSHGPFDGLDAAAREAADLAQFAAHCGRRSEVCVPAEDGRYWTIWQSEDKTPEEPIPQEELRAGIEAMKRVA